MNIIEKGAKEKILYPTQDLSRELKNSVKDR